jgi:hypothetical protein
MIDSLQSGSAVLAGGEIVCGTDESRRAIKNNKGKGENVTLTAARSSICVELILLRAKLASGINRIGEPTAQSVRDRAFPKILEIAP